MSQRPTTSENSVPVEPSTGNVFADLALSDPEGLLAKAELVRRISALLTERGLTQAKAAKLLGVDQPKVSSLLKGKLDGFSTDRLFRFLNALGQDVEVNIRPAPQGVRADTRVVASGG